VVKAEKRGREHTQYTRYTKAAKPHDHNVQRDFMTQIKELYSTPEERKKEKHSTLKEQQTKKRGKQGQD